MNPENLQETWDGYVKACYPKGCPPQQLTEIKQAFFAGAFAAFGGVTHISDTEDENEACKKLDKFYKVIMLNMNARLAQLFKFN